MGGFFLFLLVFTFCVPSPSPSPLSPVPPLPGLVGTDRSALRAGASVVVLGVSARAYYGDKFRLYFENQVALGKDPHFRVFDVLLDPMERIERALSKCNAIIWSGILSNQMCAFHNGAPPSSYYNIDESVIMGDQERNVRLSKVRKLISNRTVLKAAWFHDIHPYGYGGHGFTHIAQCVVDMGVHVLVTAALFGPEMISISSILQALKRPVEIVLFPQVFFESEKFITVPFTPAKERKYDVFLCGAARPEPYPFRHRLFNLLSQSTLSCVVCENEVAFEMTPQGKRQLGPATGEYYFAYMRASRLAITTGAGRSRYWVRKYYEIPLAGTVMVGDLPMDARSFFDNEDMVVVNDYQTDAQILDLVKSALSNPAELDSKAKRVQRKVATTFDVARMASHVLDILYPTKYQPIPPFLRKPVYGLMEHIAANSWEGLERLLLELSQQGR